MRCHFAIILSLTLATGSSLAAAPITDRDSLCSLKYGRFEQSASKHDNFEYVGSTPMEDACKTPLRPQREAICRYNYRQQEIAEACVDTYDAVTEQIRQTIQHPESR